MEDILISCITPFICPIQYKECYSIGKLRNQCETGAAMTMVSKRLRRLLQPSITKYRRCFVVMNRYKNLGEGKPCLLDLLSCGLIDESTWSDDKEQDFHFILQHLTASINYNFGTLQCRTNIRPLYMAWVNPLVPVDVAAELTIWAHDVFSITVEGYYTIDWAADVAICLERFPYRLQAFQFCLETIQ